MTELKETVLMCVLGVALAVGLSVTANDLPEEELGVKDDVAGLSVTANDLPVAEMACYFKQSYEEATRVRLGYDCL